MGKDLKITCDNCGRDITWTDSSEDYRIILGIESIHANTSMVYDVAISPALNRTYYFCGAYQPNCLLTWAKNDMRPCTEQTK